MYVSDLIIDFPFGVEDLSKLFDVVDLLENRKELIEEFKPEVQKFLVKKTFFTGPFRQKYEEMFDELIASLIKKQIIKHFDFSPEEVILLSDVTLLKMLTENYYFNTENYISTEGNTDEPKNTLQ